MERYTEKDLRWLMAWGLGMHGRSHSIFRYRVSNAGIVVHNFGNRYRDKWRIGSCDQRDNVVTWSIAHYPSIEGVLAALNGAI
jgi:hypothetical protein